MDWRLILWILLGAVLGLAYQRFIGCRSGACIIGSNRYVSMLYGALLAYILAR